MLFERKIKYLDYRRDGERLQGAGFAKLEMRGEICKLQLQISGLPIAGTLSKQIYLVAMDREEILEQIELQEGKGALQKQLPAGNLCNGISYMELQAIRIPITANSELYCRIGENVTAEPEESNDATVRDAQEPDIQEMDMIKADIIEPEAQEKTEPEESVSPIEESEEAQQTILATKWEQLSAIYPHIQPFEDERDYLKIDPADFVILGNQSYQLVHNSFLLHGYYNYKHLILSRHEWRKEARYYIGVPGNFYEREKQVALMFGFESFECKEEPAQTGTYGYYMIRVDI